MDSGLAPAARPGMTSGESKAPSPASRIPHGLMPKHPYPPGAISLESRRTIRIRLHAWRDGQAARRGDGQARPREIAPDAADARRDDGRSADLALYAGASTAGTRHHLP